MRTLLAVLLALAGLAGAAHAERIEIDASEDPDSRLEVRNIVLPDGTERELYVLIGRPLRITIGDQLLVAEHVEFDPEERVLRVIGFGTFSTGEETVQGEGLVIALREESFTGRDVLIVTEAIDVVGASAARVPGQISVADGSFSPCSRCGQEVEDYGFRAARIELFPGDRLVAFDVRLLLRGVAVARLPLLVVPLGPEDRQPRLAIETGTATERALVALDWPYVAGANAFGTFSVRYYADVVPGTGGPLLGSLLGGGVETAYLGGGLDHRFYTERGAGEARFHVTPSFLDPTAPGGRERSLVEARLAYATIEGLEGPSLELEVARDDDRRDRLVEARIASAESDAGVRVRHEARTFVDLDPTDDVRDPSYDGRAEPRRTLSRLVVEPEASSLEAGPFRLRELRVDLGAFEDQSNLLNRSAASQPLAQAGRLAQGHLFEVTALPLWSGLTLSGSNRFVGRYYSTGERLVDWTTAVEGRQGLGGIGSLRVAYRRDVGEGETPFAFDQLLVTLRRRVVLDGTLELSPVSWATLQVDGGWLFADLRRPEDVGPLPLESRLLLFGELAWIDVTIANRYDLAEPDPGELEVDVSARLPDPGVTASLEVRHVQDLAARPDRLSGEPEDTTQTEVQAEFGLRALRVDLSGGRRYAPPLPEEAGEPREYWLPLELGLTLGTLERGDAEPGLRIGYERDLNRHEPSAVSYAAAAEVGPFELTAEQAFGLDGGPGSSRYLVRLPGVAELEGEGFWLLRPAWLGLEEAAVRTLSVTVSDAPLTGPDRWRLAWRSTLDAGLGPDGGARGSQLSGNLQLTDRAVGPVRFAVDGSFLLPIEDDVVQRTYLQRATLDLGLELYGRVGLQGSLGYTAILPAGSTELSRAQLAIDDLALTVRALDELTVGAIFDDVWDLTGNTPSQSPWNLQPTVFLVWDRCCWALYAQLDTATGQVKLLLTTPGGSEGLNPVFDTPLRLPGREETP